MRKVKKPLERRPVNVLRLLLAEALRPFGMGDDLITLSECASRVLGFVIKVILHSADILSGFIVYNVVNTDSGKGRGAIDNQAAGNRIHLIERHFQIFLILLAHGTPSFLHIRNGGTQFRTSRCYHRLCQGMFQIVKHKFCSFQNRGFDILETPLNLSIFFYYTYSER